METEWNFSDAEKNGTYLGVIEFCDNDEDYHNFEVFETPTRLVFGGMCNIGFLESGYIEIDDTFSIDENLQELISDLEVFYIDGPDYTSHIVCNERM